MFFSVSSKGKIIELKWLVYKGEADDYADCIKQNWEYCYDMYSPKPVDGVFSNDTMKKVLSNFYSESFVENKITNYFQEFIYIQKIVRIKELLKLVL